MSNPIVVENALIGSASWAITQASTTQIAGYADKTSLDTGQALTLFISTQVGGTTYTIDFYRLGSYSGAGGRLLLTVAGQVGVAQGYWDGTTLQNCPTAIIDNTTHNLEAGWASSYVLTVPSTWVTGVYVAKLTDANGYQAFIPFVVRGNTSADYVYIRPVTTDAAYNAWGGFSLYTNPTVGVKVSLNRPNANGWGGAGIFDFELGGIHWLESQGYNLSYLTSVDLHTNAAQLTGYKAYISAGHDEYWTREMRDGVEAAIAGGVNCAFLGANASYWQMRFGADAASNANRSITCYKVDSKTANLATDPFFGVDNTRVTTFWRDPVINRPECTMVGIQFSSFTNSTSFPWTVDAAQNSGGFPLSGTGLVPGTSYGADVVGHEWDKVYPQSPGNVQIVGATRLVDVNGKNDVSHTTYYVAASGAFVFASGSLNWVHPLDTWRESGNPSPLTVAGIQSLMVNIMSALKGPLKGPVFSMVGV